MICTSGRRQRRARSSSKVGLISIGDLVGPGLYPFHSRFNRVINFEHPDGLISLVDETVGRGPLNIVLAGLSFLVQGPRTRQASFSQSSTIRSLRNVARRQMVPPLPGGEGRGEGERGHSTSECGTASPPLIVRADTVQYNGCRFRFNSRHRYCSTFDFEPGDPGRLSANLVILGECLKESAPPNSLAFLLDATRLKHFRSAFDRAFARQVRAGVRRVFLGRVTEGIGSLKGCGAGLTPSGDDLITGLLIGLKLMQHIHRRDLSAAADVLYHAACGTNVFSNTFLGLAYRGRLFGHTKALLGALLNGDRREVRATAARSLALGHSSGADLLTGVFLALTRPMPLSLPMNRPWFMGRAHVFERGGFP